MKAWYQSKTILGAAVMIGSVAAGRFGVDVSPDIQVDIVDALELAGTAIGALLTVWGRVTASKPVGLRRRA